MIFILLTWDYSHILYSQQFSNIIVNKFSTETADVLLPEFINRLILYTLNIKCTTVESLGYKENGYNKFTAIMSHYKSRFQFKYITIQIYTDILYE